MIDCRLPAGSVVAVIRGVELLAPWITIDPVSAPERSPAFAARSTRIRPPPTRALRVRWCR